MMKSGRMNDAELEFKQLALAYPDLAGPEVNLGLLYLRAARLGFDTGYTAVYQVRVRRPV